MVLESLFVTLDPSDPHLAQENKGFRGVDFHFLQFAILHMFYKVYGGFAKVKNRRHETICFPVPNGGPKGPKTQKGGSRPRVA